jgi:hypothetical protein
MPAGEVKGKKRASDREPPGPPKRRWERRLRHASRVSKPRPPAIREGRTLADERAWTDWIEPTFHEGREALLTIKRSRFRQIAFNAIFAAIQKAELGAHRS